MLCFEVGFGGLHVAALTSIHTVSFIWLWKLLKHHCVRSFVFAQYRCMAQMKKNAGLLVETSTNRGRFDEVVHELVRILATIEEDGGRLSLDVGHRPEDAETLLRLSKVRWTEMLPLTLLKFLKIRLRANFF